VIVNKYTLQTHASVSLFKLDYFNSWFYDRHGKQTSYNIKVYLIYKINQFNKSELFLTYSYVPEYGSVHFHHAVIWPFRLWVVFCLFGGFRSFFDGFILFRSWMALIFILFLLNIFFRAPLSTEQPGQSEGSLSRHQIWRHPTMTLVQLIVPCMIYPAYQRLQYMVRQRQLFNKDHNSR
jgi:hypothetical protein